MFLQSEVDDARRHSILKITLTGLVVVFVGITLFIVIQARQAAHVPPVGLTPITTQEEESPTTPSPEELAKKLDALSQQKNETTQVMMPSPEELAKKLDTLNKTPTGETPKSPSPEELAKKLNDLTAKK